MITAYEESCLSVIFNVLLHLVSLNAPKNGDGYLGAYGGSEEQTAKDIKDPIV
jgi:hypothetical protein